MTRSPDQTTPADGDPLFPMTRRCPFDPPADYARLRDEAPVSRVRLRVNDKPAWLLTRYEHVRQVLGDPRAGSDLRQPGYPLQVPVPEELLAQIPLTLLSLDPPRHTVQRRMLIPEFTARRVQAMRPQLQRIVDSHIDALLAAGGPADLVSALALPVPSQLMCELLGVPYEDHEQFHRWTTAVMDRDATDAERGAAHAGIDAYLDRLVTAKEHRPTDDLISRLVAKNREDPQVGHADLVSMARILLVAGHETSANMLSLGVLALLENPDQLALLRADPTTAAGAADELLRYFSISDTATARVALEDIQVGDTLIRAGEGIIAGNGAANRDPAVYPDPDRVDITRNARQHLAFGYGIHQCLGATLARLELEVVYRTLFTRVPGLRLATPVSDLQFKDGALVYGLHALPVTW